jgi:chlorite dismutase
MMHHETKLDLREKGRGKDGQPIFLDQRLFMQLLAYGGCKDSGPLVAALQQANIEGVLYADLHDPQGVALLTFHENPDYFLTQIRSLLNQPPFTALIPKPEYTLFGRTYALGYESDLEEWLLKQPRRKVLNPRWPWAVWYPLRRSGSFEQLSAEEQMRILREHGGLAATFGQADSVHDIRLTCHGLDKNDNDFVIALLGYELYPLSAIVQAMRKTQQTSLYLERLGPFFVGKVVWQSKMPQ